MKHAIILSGGLGNQMFQYAFFLSLLNKKIACKIDTSMFDVVKMHNGFELSRVFGVELNNEYTFIHKKLIQFMRRYKPSLFVYTDTIYKYDVNVYQATQKYLIGDWISSKYFDDITNVIHSTYSFKNINDYNIEFAEKMRNSNSVSLHIRRGDYLKLPNYCVCNENYYKLAIENILAHVENPILYVFSNEPSWCNEFMKQFGVMYVIVDWNQGKESYQDMYLMTQCKHNIIANSTFSWWGAWLNQNKDKIVIAPNKWFKNNNLNANCPDWTLINVENE